MLYKFTPTLEIAKQISIGIFRFYELTKYIKIEDKVGRSDSAECSVSFPKEEYNLFPDKLPTGSYNGIEFQCISIRPDNEYIKQYFVFCTSTKMNVQTIGDSKYVVELYEDTFDLFMQLLNAPEESSSNTNGNRFFSHGQVSYYNIHKHPEPFLKDRWREVYVKHTDFDYQNEYRAALFASDHFFERTKDKPRVILRRMFTTEGKEMNFKLKLSLHSGIDEDGWRYVEFDLSEFATNMRREPSKITDLSSVEYEY